MSDRNVCRLRTKDVHRPYVWERKHGVIATVKLIVGRLPRYCRVTSRRDCRSNGVDVDVISRALYKRIGNKAISYVASGYVRLRFVGASDFIVL